MIEDLLLRADPLTVRAFGEYFAELGRVLLEKANAGAELDAFNASRREREAHRRGAARQVASEFEAGRDLDEAIADVAARLDMEPAQLRVWVKMYQPERAMRLARDREMMLHANRGWTDAEIGRKFGMHAKSANRIIRRMLRAGRPTVSREVGHG